MRIENPLTVRSQPRFRDGKMILAFSGWMDGGDVSTGTVKWLVNAMNTEEAAELDPEGFYIYNFPGPMETSALFRPHTRIDDGVIRAYQPPKNTFYAENDRELLLFSGKEPHLNWEVFANSLFSFAADVGVSSVFFIGSFGGAVPHTREPRVMSTVSHESMKPTLEPYISKFTEYQGPASFSTHLMAHADDFKLQMASLVTEIPAYIQGTNPKCIQAIAKKLAAVLDLQVDLEPLRPVTAAWERRLNKVLEEEEELAEHISKLEQIYDDEVFDTQMEDLKEWLEQRGVRLD
ncbi:MAG: PAC2 family protein [Phycisphaerae bacterium]|jgi:proteasome assembly chaperone (PAC2) family protein